VKKEKVIVSNLTKSYGDLLVLDNISFSVDDGEFLVIVGPTGCGKTTFLNSMTKIIDINGLYTPRIFSTSLAEC
jgi:sulfonate transport system ATP-binding protein